MPTRHEMVARALADEGVHDAFGVMGVGNLHLLHDLVSQHDLRYHAARIEGGAVSMADGYARVSGDVGVAVVTQGPGLTNAITALTAVARLGSRVLVITGDMPAATPKGTSQQIDHCALVETTGAAFRTLDATDDWYTATRECVQSIRHRSRPLVLNLPNDLQSQPAPGTAQPPCDEPAVAPPPPDPEAIARAAELIRSARLPLVLAGRGAIGAKDEIAELGRRAGAVLGTTLLAKDLFANDPWSIGIVGGFASRNARLVLREVDCVVSLGAGLNTWTTKQGSLLADRRLVQCDTDPAAIARLGRADVGLVADAAEVAAALADALGAAPAEGPGRGSGLSEVIHAEPHDDISAAGATGIHPRAALRRLDALLPANRLLVTDGGHFVGFPAANMRVRHPQDFVFTQNFGTIGLGLGAAIGAATGRPDRLCVLVAGDGGFSMSMVDLDTAIRLGLSMLIVILNDGGYGAEFHAMETSGMPIDLALFTNPDFAAVASAFGGDGRRVTTLEELGSAVAGFDVGQGVRLLDVRVDATIVDRWMSDRFPEGDPRKESV
jgi:acetolactate synthase-1/2/3 large subunit